MESRAKLAGHPIHPMLIVFPLGLFVMACILDAAALLTGARGLYVVSYWNIIGGVISGLSAAVFGWIDWFAIPGNTRAKSIGLWHGLGNMLIVGMFAISGLLRFAVAGKMPSSAALALSFGAIVIGLATAWMGGELVNRLGVGVDAGANLNAPSSLSGRPADAGEYSESAEPDTYRRAA